MERFHKDIVVCYLYTITKHGYPPVAQNSLQHLDEFSELGFTSIELEGIREERDKNLGRFRRGCEVAHALGSHAVLDNAPLPPWQFPGDIPVTRHYDEEVLAAATIPEHLAPGEGMIQWERFFAMLERINYSGKFGIDVGGAESDVSDLDGAYRDAANWLTEQWFSKRS